MNADPAPDMTRTTYAITLAYDGTPFWGFAQQPNLVTVESTLLRALRPWVPDLPCIAVGGRTDRGVHATRQTVSFWSTKPLAEEAIAQAIDDAHPALTSLGVKQVPNQFHARFSAHTRRYAYFFPDAQVEVNIGRLRALLTELLGRRCFSAFARDTPKRPTTVRRLDQASVRHVQHQGSTHVRFDFAAEGFLRRQVRVMVATALREAKNQSPQNRLAEIARSQDRTQSAPPAPPDGLYLTQIGYAAHPLKRSLTRTH